MEVEVISNTANIQAVKNRELKLSQIAFYQPGSIEVDDKTIVTVNNPCLVTLQDMGKETKLSVSDPTQKLKVIKIELSGKLQGDGREFDPIKNLTTISVTLPQGGYAEQSVVRILQRYHFGFQSF